VLRDVHEYILIFSKGDFGRKRGEGQEDTIEKEDFMAWTKSVWDMNTESAKKVGHPAPFPEELPHRLIQLYSFTGDVILDPFMGSGTTAVAALKAGRKYIGYEIEPDYIKLANERIGALGE
jgi:site-specific DNA-methyltransferase (adenine-specific)